MSNLMARVGTPNLLARLFSGNAILHARPDFEIAAGERWHHRIMAEEVTDKLHQKQGRSIARWSLPGMTLFLKRHYVLPWRHAMGAILFPKQAWSPGLQEWHNLQWAEKQGIRVPRAVAAAEWRGPGLTLQSFLAVDELTGMLPLHEAIPLASQSLSPAAFSSWKRRLIPELARLSAALHNRDHYHKDLYLCHFYLAESMCRFVPSSFAEQVAMIDFHRLGRHVLGGLWFQVKDLAQLLYSTSEVDGISDRDRLRFWKHYRPLTQARTWLPGWIQMKYRLYLRHSRRVAARQRT